MEVKIVYSDLPIFEEEDVWNYEELLEQYKEIIQFKSVGVILVKFQNDFYLVDLTFLPTKKIDSYCDVSLLDFIVKIICKGELDGYSYLASVDFANLAVEIMDMCTNISDKLVIAPVGKKTVYMPAITLTLVEDIQDPLVLDYLEEHNLQRIMDELIDDLDED